MNPMRIFLTLALTFLVCSAALAETVVVKFASLAPKGTT